jgi:hypothetical protein
MKRVIRLFIIALLLLASVGVSVTKHYCGDILKSISVNAKPENCCGDKDMPNGCCEDESENYFLDQNMKIQQIIPVLNPPVTEIDNDLNHLLIISNFDVTNRNLNFYYKCPPPFEPELFVKFRSFLI